MSISQGGREKAEEDCKGHIISYVFSDQLKAESLCQADRVLLLAGISEGYKKYV